MSKPCTNPTETESIIYTDQDTLAELGKYVSCDLMIENKIREPFLYKGKRFAVSGSLSSGAGEYISVWVHELILAHLYKGKTINYSEMVKQWDEGIVSRGNQIGHLVKYGSVSYVIGARTLFKFDPKQKSETVIKSQPKLF